MANNPTPQKAAAMNKAVHAVMQDDIPQNIAAARYGVKLQTLRNRLCYARKEAQRAKGLHPALLIMKEAHHG